MNVCTYIIVLENAHVVQFTVTHGDLIGSCAYIQISWAGVYKHNMLDYKNICSQKYSSVILSHASSLNPVVL